MFEDEYSMIKLKRLLSKYGTPKHALDLAYVSHSMVCASFYDTTPGWGGHHTGLTIHSLFSMLPDSSNRYTQLDAYGSSSL